MPYSIFDVVSMMIARAASTISFYLIQAVLVRSSMLLSVSTLFSFFTAFSGLGIKEIVIKVAPTHVVAFTH